MSNELVFPLEPFASWLISQAVEDVKEFVCKDLTEEVSGATRVSRNQQRFRRRQTINNAIHAIAWVYAEPIKDSTSLSLHECCTLCNLDITTVRDNFSKLLMTLTAEQKQILAEGVQVG